MEIQKFPFYYKHQHICFSEFIFKLQHYRLMHHLYRNLPTIKVYFISTQMQSIVRKGFQYFCKKRFHKLVGRFLWGIHRTKFVCSFVIPIALCEQVLIALSPRKRMTWWNGNKKCVSFISRDSELCCDQVPSQHMHTAQPSVWAC